MDSRASDGTVYLWGGGNKSAGNGKSKDERNVVLKNLRTGRSFSFELRHHFVVGRNGEASDLRITEDDRYMSGKHVCFYNGSDGVYVEDMHTKNGTRLNGKRISSKTRLQRGDVLRMGRSEFEVIF